MDSNRIFAGVSLSLNWHEGGIILLSDDSGTSWQTMDTMTSAPTSLNTNTATFFAGTYGNGVFLSTDKGSSWFSSSLTNSDGDIDGLQIIGTNVFAADLYNGGVFRSPDAGSHWTTIDSGLTNKWVSALFADGENLFAGGYFEGGGGIFLTTNNGIFWESFGVGLPRVSISGIAVVDTFIFLGTEAYYPQPGLGIFRSGIKDRTWFPVNSGLTTSNVSCIIGNNGNLFVGTYSAGIFLSTDDGLSWFPVNDGLGDAYITALTFDKDYLFAGVWNYLNGCSIWRRPLPEMITSSETAFDTPSLHFELQQNYPNPFNPSTEIELSIAKSEFVSLKIYDILGREVKTLLSEFLFPGTHRVQWDARGETGGIYFYQRVL